MREYSQKELVQQEFTRQARSYARNPSVVDPDRIAHLVAIVSPPPRARVLDIATGPGSVAMGFGDICESVVGLDLTLAPLKIAEQRRRDRELANVSFLAGDAEQLPFPDGSFDVGVCRFAFHHVERPSVVLREMTRVARRGARIAVEDIIVSEHAVRGAYQNQFERLRDPSHARALPLGELLQTFVAAGLEVESVSTGEIHHAVEQWLENAHAPSDRAARARSMIERDFAEDLSGARPYVHDGVLHFVQRTALVIGRRLR